MVLHLSKIGHFLSLLASQPIYRLFEAWNYGGEVSLWHVKSLKMSASRDETFGCSTHTLCPRRLVVNAPDGNLLKSLPLAFVHILPGKS